MGKLGGGGAEKKAKACPSQNAHFSRGAKLTEKGGRVRANTEPPSRCQGKRGKRIYQIQKNKDEEDMIYMKVRPKKLEGEGERGVLRD